MEDLKWKTAITSVERNKLLIRGYQLDKLMGRITYGQMLYLILKGELPSDGVGKVVDAIMISSVDHGATPPSTLAAITAASTGATINACLAVGILSINKHHGGAIEGCMELILKAHKIWKEKSITIEQAAIEIVEECRQKKIKIPGLGHRFHTKDPRTAKLFEIADYEGVSGDHVLMLKTIERQVEKSLGKSLPINVDGAIASILCELNIEPEIANAFFIIARLPGLLAHVLEEKTRQKPMRQIHPTEHEYDGIPERDVEEAFQKI